MDRRRIIRSRTTVFLPPTASTALRASWAVANRIEPDGELVSRRQFRFFIAGQRADCYGQWWSELARSLGLSETVRVPAADWYRPRTNGALTFGIAPNSVGGTKIAMSPRTARSFIPAPLDIIVAPDPGFDASCFGIVKDVELLHLVDGLASYYRADDFEVFDFVVRDGVEVVG